MESKTFISGNSRFIYKVPSTSENDSPPTRFDKTRFEDELKRWRENKRTDRAEIEEALFQLAKKPQRGGQSSRVSIQCAHLDHSPTFYISTSLYNKIRSQLLVHEDALPCPLIELLWLLYMRYDSLGLLSGFSGAITPEVYTSFSNNPSTSTRVECFASFFNHTLTYYFGIYYELERYFGCLGNFFDVEFVSGFYLCNPPFTVGLINLTVQHLKRHLVHRSSDSPALSFLLVTPTWDKTDRDKLNMRTKEYGDEEKLLSRVSLRDERDSSWLEFVKHYVLYAKGSFLYFDYEKEDYISYCATTVSFLSTASDPAQLDAVKSILPTPTMVCTTRDSKIGGNAHRRRRHSTRKRTTTQRRKPSSRRKRGQRIKRTVRRQSRRGGVLRRRKSAGSRRSRKRT